MISLNLKFNMIQVFLRKFCYLDTQTDNLWSDHLLTSYLLQLLCDNIQVIQCCQGNMVPHELLTKPHKVPEPLRGDPWVQPPSGRRLLQSQETAAGHEHVLNWETESFALRITYLCNRPAYHLIYCRGRNNVSCSILPSWLSKGALPLRPVVPYFADAQNAPYPHSPEPPPALLHSQYRKYKREQWVWPLNNHVLSSTFESVDWVSSIPLIKNLTY